MVGFVLLDIWDLLSRLLGQYLFPGFASLCQRHTLKLTTSNDWMNVNDEVGRL